MQVKNDKGMRLKIILVSLQKMDHDENHHHHPFR